MREIVGDMAISVRVDDYLAELLHKTRHSRRFALRDDGANPGQIAGAGIGAALAADNDPIERVESPVEWSQQRLARQEPHRRRRLQEQPYPLVGALLVLDGDAEPDIREW